MCSRKRGSFEERAPQHTQSEAHRLYGPLAARRPEGRRGSGETMAGERRREGLARFRGRRGPRHREEAAGSGRKQGSVAVSSICTAPAASERPGRWLVRCRRPGARVEFSVRLRDRLDFGRIRHRNCSSSTGTPREQASGHRHRAGTAAATGQSTRSSARRDPSDSAALRRPIRQKADVRHPPRTDSNTPIHTCRAPLRRQSV